MTRHSHSVTVTSHFHRCNGQHQHPGPVNGDILRWEGSAQYHQSHCDGGNIYTYTLQRYTSSCREGIKLSSQIFRCLSFGLLTFIVHFFLLFKTMKSWGFIGVFILMFMVGGIKGSGRRNKIQTCEISINGKLIK